MDRTAEVREKHGRVAAWLDAAGLEAVLIARPSNFAWLMAGAASYVSLSAPAGVAAALVTKSRLHVLTNVIEQQRLLDEELPAFPFEMVVSPWEERADFAGVAARMTEPGRTAADVPAAGLAPVDRGFDTLRFSLLPPELDRYRALGLDAAKAVEATCRSIEGGESEHLVAAQLAERCRERGIVPLVNLIAAGHRIAKYRHPLPTFNTVTDSVMVVLTGWRHGLHASLTRIVSLKRPDGELAGRHDKVTQVDARLIAESRPDATLGQVLQAGLDEYAAAGFPDEWKLHHQGGLTGYAGREIFAVPGEPFALAAYQALAWNPSITGTKSEDTVLITPNGPELLTRTGEWPERDVAVEGTAVPRPEIFVPGDNG